MLRETLGLIRSDLAAKARWLYERDDATAQPKAPATDGTAAMVLYRCMQGSRRAGLCFLEMVFNKLNAAVGGCIIGRGAESGPGFVLVHSDGVVINGTVRRRQDRAPGDDRRGEAREPVVAPCRAPRSAAYATNH